MFISINLEKALAKKEKFPFEVNCQLINYYLPNNYQKQDCIIHKVKIMLFMVFIENIA
jgi:hypothetical protein